MSDPLKLETNSTQLEAKDAAEPVIVDWESGDPEDSMNWPPSRKWLTMALVSSLALVTHLGSSVLAPGVPQLLHEFQSENKELGYFVVSVYVLGFAFGPLLLSPLSEIYGRAIIFNITNVLFVAFTIGCAFAPSLGALIGLRFLMGFAGSAPTAVGAGTIADIFLPQDRGKATSVYGVGPIIGPVIAPVIGGFLGENRGWRWIFRFMAILGGVMTIMTITFFKETYRPVLLARKVARLRRSTSNTNLKSKLDTGRTVRQTLQLALLRPLKLLTGSPIIFVPCLSVSVVFGYFYILITTFPTVFQSQYHFSTGSVGLAYLGLGLGNIIGMLFFAMTSDRYLKRKLRHGPIKPEDRLAPIALGGPLICVGLLWYGWSADKRVHWIMPILGSGIFGIGFMAFMMPVITYLIDCCRQYAASAISANILLRSIVGSVLPLIADRLYSRLGLGWGNSLLAFIALSTSPLPWLYYFYGERLRLRYPVNKIVA